MLLSAHEALIGVLVGVLWGVTNPLVKRGSLQVEQRLKAAARSGNDRRGGEAARAPQRSVRSSDAGGGPGWAAEWRAHLVTPAFIVPHAVNQVGGVGSLITRLCCARGAGVYVRMRAGALCDGPGVQRSSRTPR